MASCHTSPDQASMPIRALSGWSYEVKTNNPGTRSEGKIGVLFYGDYSLEWYYHYIYIPSEEKSFLCQEKAQLWDFGGFRQIENKVFTSESGSSSIAGGWFETKPLSKPNGIPASWIYVERDEMAFWLDPGHYRDLAIEQGFQILGTEFIKRPISKP